MRLDKYLADMSVGSRSTVKEYIRKGKITVNEKTVTKADIQIVPGVDVICVCGKETDYVTKEYYMLNKPAGVLSATQDKKCKTVLDLIPDKKRRDLFPVGRLDKDTEGLLLITNDGDMAHRLLSPKKHVGKVYYARVDGRVTEEMVHVFKKGLSLGEDVITLPAELVIIKQTEDKSEIQLTIYEGKFHQVKRMFEAVGLTVTYLKRLSMGNLILDPLLEPGDSRPLTPEELDILRKDMKIC